MISISILTGRLDPCSFVTDEGRGGAVNFRRPYGTRFVLVGGDPPVNWRAIISGPSGAHWGLPLFLGRRIAPGRFGENRPWCMSGESPAACEGKSSACGRRRIVCGS